MAGPMPDDDMDAKLRRFEGMADPDDPEQMALLEQMREHTKNLHRIRGDWDKPSTEGDWNPAPPVQGSKPPLELPDYRAYKEHKLLEGRHQGKGRPPPALANGGEEQ